MGVEVQYEFGKPFVYGCVFGLLGYTASTRAQKIPFVRRPWVLLGSMVGLGIVLTGFDAVIRAVKEDLPRKKLLFVQRRREKYIGQEQPDDAGKQLYDQIVKELEAEGISVVKKE